MTAGQAEYIRHHYGICRALRDDGSCYCFRRANIEKRSLAIEEQHGCEHYEQAPLFDSWAAFVGWQDAHR